MVSQDSGGTANGGVDKATNAFTISVTPVNDPPVITLASNNVLVLEDAGVTAVPGFVTTSPGPANESAQSVTNLTVLSVSNPSLFSVQPALALNGTLTFTTATNANGAATVTIMAQDNGGTANGGIDSTTNAFTLTVIPVNDPPVITLASNNVTVLEDAGVVTVLGFVTVSSYGAPNETNQSILGYTLTADAPALFSVPPALSLAGTLTFTPATNANGVTTVTVVSQDNGGTAYGGVDKATNTFTISIAPVNDPPSFTLNGNYFTAGASTTLVSWGNQILPTGANGSFARVAAGGLCSLAVKSNGTVVAWGNFYDPTVLDGLSNVVAMAAGYYHSLAVRADGTVVAWGDNSYDEATVPDGLSNVLAVAVGFYHSLALRADGTVVAWGENWFGETTVPSGLSNVVAVAAGGYHNLALKNDGTVVAWGDNNSGQTTVPVGLSNVVAVAAGGYHNLALKNDGTVVAWGDNSSGQTTALVGLSNVVAVSAGDAHSLALKNDGTVVAWGYNWQGQTTVPVGLSNVVAVASGSLHNLVLKSDGTLVAWGDNTYGETFVPGGLSNVVAVAEGSSHTLALKTDGTVMAWGDNGYGQTTVPAGLSNVVALGAGNLHSLALKCDGTVVAWGQYYNGSAYVPMTVPVGLSNVVAVGASYWHSLALKNDGTVVAWGYNGYGETTVPVGLSNVVAVGAGYWHSLALKNDGTVVAWGDNSYGATTVPAGLSNVVSVAAGDFYSLAVKRDGTVVAWGQYYNGSAYVPMTVPAGLSNVVAVGAGYWHSLALKNNGTVVACGYNGQGQTTVPVGLSNVVAVAAGGFTSLAVVTNTSVVALSSTIAEDSGPQTLPNAVTNISPGPLDEATQTVTFIVTNDTPSLFGVQPAISPSGTLTYTPTNTFGVATVTVYAKDNGGTANGGVDTSAPQTFTITITPVNDPPMIALATNNLVVLEDAGSVSVPSFATVTSYGANETNQTLLGYTLTADAPALFSVQPALALNGTLTFTTATNANGVTTVTVVSQDSGGTAYGGMDKATNTFTLTVLPVNDPPSFKPGIGSPGLQPSQVIGWGDNSDNQSQFLPPGVTFTNLAAGGYNSLAIKNDGSLLALGDNTYGQTTVPAGAQKGVKAVAAGMQFLLALKTNGAVVAWGKNSVGQTNVPVGAQSGIMAIAAGWLHCLALKTNGAVIAWGDNSAGQTNVPPGAQSGVVAIAAGYNFSLALRNDGSVVAWGDNSVGQTNVPAGALSGVGAIAAGHNHCLALKADGSIVAWGDNSFGQTGVPAAAQSGVLAVAAGMQFSVALRNDGAVVVWGNYSHVPTGAQSGVVAIAAGGQHILALKSDGSILGWGYDYFGQTDFPVMAPSGVASLAAGWGFSLALKTNGMVVAWGHNYFGQAEVPIPAQSGVLAIAAGEYHSLALKTNGAVVAWGDNSVGQTNVPPGAQSGVTAIAAGGLHNLALKSDGSVVAWGDNSAGQTTVPVGAQSGVVAVAGGYHHSLALRSDGSVVAWGDPTYGQTNVPAGALSGVVAIAAGGQRSLALRSDGTVVVWGDAYSSATMPSGLSGVVAIAAGNAFSLALKNDGSAIGWGDNSLGQISVPAGAQGGILAVAAGMFHSLAIVTNVMGVGVTEDSGPQSLPNAVTNISPGPANESAQTVSFVVTNDTPGLFSAQPAISPSGTLTYTPATNRYGVATVTVYAKDNGGTANGGMNTSAPWKFTITITPVNDPPIIGLATNNVVVLEDAGSVTVPSFATVTSYGANETNQTLLGYTVTVNVSTLFSVQPALDVNGTLTFTTTTNANGVTAVTVVAQDNGGTAYGGLDKTTNTFTITLTPVNDPPIITLASNNVVVLEDASAVTVPGLVSTSRGPANESAQSVTNLTVLSVSNPSLFSVQPALALNGTLTFTTATNANGVATVTIMAQDNGGTANGGVDKATNSFTVTVTPVNDPPIITFATNNLAVQANGTPVTVPGFATVASFGAPNETNQTLLGYTVTASTPALFNVQPALDLSGTLTFTPVFNTEGFSTIAVVAQDNGGTANGGLDKATNTFVITLHVPPSITTQPLSRSDLIGSSASFSVGALGAAPLSYQWYQNGSAIPTATNSTLSLQSLALSHAGGYTVVVTNAYGTVTSTVATLTVLLQGYNFTTLAGLTGTYGSIDAAGTNARLNAPYGVALDGAGNVYFSDSVNYTLRKATPAGGVTTLAGLAGILGSANGTSNSARFFFPRGVAVDGATNLYVADAANHTIRKITPAGVVSTYAGIPGTNGSTDGPAGLARFYNPSGVAVDSATNVYVADTANHTIRLITPAGVVSTVAGSAANPGSADGTNAVARFYNPSGVAVDAVGNLYVADTGNHTIRRIAPGGVVTTVAGSSGNSGSADGTGSAARFYSPSGVAVDVTGSLYVADTGNQTIRKLTPGGTASTVGGLASAAGSSDGTGANAQFWAPEGIAVDGSGNLYVTDYSNNTLRKGQLLGLPSIVAPPQGLLVGVGSNAAFNVTAWGAQPLSYQWRLNGGAVAQATNATLALTNVQVGNAGNYDVVVTDSYGSVTSAVAMLTLVLPPTITTQPLSLTTVATSNATFSVSAAGTAPLSYQWFKDGLAVGGAVNSNYVLGSVQTNQAGQYSVLITNLAGSVTSRVASLTVLLSATNTSFRFGGAGAAFTNGNFHLRLNCPPGAGIIVVEASPDLETWQPVLTNYFNGTPVNVAVPMGTNRNQYLRSRTGQ
ncbi:MAG: immunoglobulin domain-containing protein [Verrucomicrobiota bacterium]